MPFVALIEGNARSVHFTLKMEVGTHVVFISSPGYYETARQLTFVSGVEAPLVRVLLEAKQRPVFPSFTALDSKVKGILRRSTRAKTQAAAIKLLARLSAGRKAGMFNVLAKMQAVQVAPPKPRTVLDHVDRIYEFRQDRIYVRLKEGSSLKDDIEQSIAAGGTRFSEAAAALHKGFTDASFKTLEPTRTGNLQLSFNTRNRRRLKVDADIDIYADVLRHLFGEVFRNHLTGTRTDPYQVHRVLVRNDIHPAYDLADRDLPAV